MPLTLYGSPRTRASRCLWMLEELGLPYEHVPLNPVVGQTRTPAYLAINPLGKVPTLVDAALILTESTAINIYLAERQPTALWPGDTVARARIHQWTSWATTELEFPLTVMVRAMRAAAPELPDAALVKGCLEDCATAMGALESYLAAGHQWVADDEFTVGDINVAFSVNFVASRLEMDRFPTAKDWLDRCLQRPAWKRVAALMAAA